MSAAQLTSAAEHPRAEARKAQILTAAADCFRSHGFHGASISQISKACRMSPGHIYHYFENKEAIIAAIVEQDVERLMRLFREIRSARDVLQAMLEEATGGVADKLDPHTAGLKVEIVAEASRNPRVAEIVHSADQLCMGELKETIRALRAARGYEDCEAELTARTEIIASLFEGLMIRNIRNPELDAATVTRMFRSAFRDMLTSPPDSEG